MPQKEKTLTRADLYSQVYDQIGYSRSFSARMVDSVFHIICSKLLTSHNIKLSGFGSFLLYSKKARLARDLKKNKEIVLPPRRVMVFHPSPVFKKMVNGTRPLKPKRLSG